MFKKLLLFLSLTVLTTLDVTPVLAGEWNDVEDTEKKNSLLELVGLLNYSNYFNSDFSIDCLKESNPDVTFVVKERSSESGENIESFFTENAPSRDTFNEVVVTDDEKKNASSSMKAQRISRRLRSAIIEQLRDAGCAKTENEDDIVKVGDIFVKEFDSLLNSLQDPEYKDALKIYYSNDATKDPLLLFFFNNRDNKVQYAVLLRLREGLEETEEAEVSWEEASKEDWKGVVKSFSKSILQLSDVFESLERAEYCSYSGRDNEELWFQFDIFDPSDPNVPLLTLRDSLLKNLELPNKYEVFNTAPDDKAVKNLASALSSIYQSGLSSECLDSIGSDLVTAADGASGLLRTLKMENKETFDVVFSVGEEGSQFVVLIRQQPNWAQAIYLHPKNAR